MQWLAALCVKRPVFATVLILSLTVIGAFSFTRLGVDRFPKVDFPTITITTVQPGAAPEQIETEITDKIEEAVNTISGIDDLRSVSSEGISQVIVAFLLEKDTDVAAQEVRDKVNGVLPRLPKTVQQPRVDKVDPDAAPVLSLALTASKPVRDITEYADKVLRRQLESVNGVGQVLILGGRQRQINIWLDADRLRAYNLTVTDVSHAVQGQNIEIPGGRLDQGPQSVTLRTRGRVQAVADFNDIVVREKDGHPVRIGDVARVEDGEAESETVANVNGTGTVLLQVRRQSGTNTVEVVQALKDRLQTLSRALPAGYSVRIVRDTSEFIEAAIHNVEEHLVVGSILAAIVVLLFLTNLRSTVISAIAIPTSIIATFGMLWYMGFTLNLMTMLALTLSVGIVIDDAIVVLENIYRFVEEKHEAKVEAAIDATKEIGLAVLVLLSSVPLFMAANKNFMPQDDQGEFEVNIRAPEGTSLEATEVLTNRIANTIRDRVPEVDYTLVTVAGDPAKTRNSSNVYIRLRPIDTRTRDQFTLMDVIRKQVLPPMTANLRTSVQEVAVIGGSGAQAAAIQFVINSPDLNKLETISRQLVDRVRPLPGVVDIDTSLNTGKPELSVQVDRPKAADLGVQIGDAAEALRLLVGGDQVSTYNEGGEQYEVHLRARVEDRSTESAIAALTVPSSRLGSVALNDIADFAASSAPSD